MVLPQKKTGEMRMAKISVIIPVYDAEEYLRECLNSVLGQSLHDISIGGWWRVWRANAQEKGGNDSAIRRIGQFF